MRSRWGSRSTVVDGIEALVPMAIEELLRHVAASHAARLARPEGFTCEVAPPIMTGQIQITQVDDVQAGARQAARGRR